MYITFPSKIMVSKLRYLFTVDKIQNDIIFLKRGNNESLEIHSNGNISNHYRDAHKMNMTYIADKKTLQELKKVKKKLLFKKIIVSLYS